MEIDNYHFESTRWDGSESLKIEGNTNSSETGRQGDAAVFLKPD